MAQPRYFQQRPISKEEKLAWIYRSDLHTRTNPADKSQQAYEMNRQTINEMGAASASSAATPCNITPPVLSSSQSDHIFHTRSMMNFGSSSQAQPTSYQQPPPQPLGACQGPSATGDRSNGQEHSEELVREDLEIQATQPEIDPLGSERVRIAARKEVRRRQLENKNTRLNVFMKQADPGQAPETTSRETEITRLEVMMDEQMKDIKGAVDKIESEAKFWLLGQQYRSTMDLAGPSQEPASEYSETPPSTKGLSTCYYWDKHQNDNSQPPCQMGLNCRFPHCRVEWVPVASTEYKADANQRRGWSPASLARKHRQVTERRHDRARAPSFTPPFQINHPISRRPIDKASMKYPPPPRPSGPSPLGSSQRSMAKLRVPQVSLPLRPKVKSAPLAFQDTEVNIFGQSSLGYSQREIYDLRTLPEESYVKRDDPLDLSSPFSSARRYHSSYFSQESGSVQHTSEWSNASMEIAFNSQGRRRTATEVALRGEEEYCQWLNDNQPGSMVPVETSHPRSLMFAVGAHVHPLSTSSPKYQAKKLEREFRESEERGEREIFERARAGSMGTIDRPEPGDHFKTASMNALNVAEEESISYSPGCKRKLRDTLQGHPYLKDMSDCVDFNGTSSSGNVFKNSATKTDQPEPKKPLVIRPRPINPAKQEAAPAISAPKVEQPKCEPLNVEKTQHPMLGLAKKKWTTAELIRRHKLAIQNSEVKREMLHSAGVRGALDGALGENIQTALRQPEAKDPAPKQTSQLETDKPAPKPDHTEDDDHFSDVELADEEKASLGVNGEEEEDWIIVENIV